MEHQTNNTNVHYCKYKCSFGLDPNQSDVLWALFTNKQWETFYKYVFLPLKAHVVNNKYRIICCLSMIYYSLLYNFVYLQAFSYFLNDLCQFFINIYQKTGKYQVRY